MKEKQKSQTINEIFIYIAISIALSIFVIASFPELGIKITQNQILLLIVILVLLIFRHFSKIELLGFLRLSREVKEVKRETREIRSALQSLALSISAASSSAVVNIGKMINSTAEDARELESELPSMPSQREISDQMSSDVQNITRLIESSQFVAAFATLRNRIETELREILRLGGVEMERASLFRLARRVAKLRNIDPTIIEAVSVVGNAANTVVHSTPYDQTIPMEKARYISELGIKTLYQLRKTKNQISSSVNTSG